jgi:hypothetical protein
LFKNYLKEICLDEKDDKCNGLYMLKRQYIGCF